MIEYLLLFTIFMLLVLEFYKNLVAYQQNQYIILRYIKTLFRKQRFVSISGILALLLVLFIKNEIVLLTGLFITMFISYVIEYNKNYKVKFNFTARMKRISVVIIACLFVVTVFVPSNILCVILSLSGFSFIIFHFLLLPIETNIRKGFIRKAKKHLKSANVKVVGITGSYGKTTSKNILYDILKNDVHTLPTPKSFNTPMGLAITINNDLTPLHEVFIAEMGAYKVGEIDENCRIVNPDIAIITSIGKAHLESFGSQDNVLKGKFELVEALPKDGLAVLNADDELMMSYKINNSCCIKTYSIDNESDLRAYNILTTSNGLSFCVNIDNKEYFIKTKLLGKHNVYNILACMHVALYLGVDIERIVKNISQVNVISHRLELRKVRGATIIDDAFNSNPVGAKEAAITLGQMEGYRVAMTPGMIELGESEFELNKQFAIQLSENASLVYVVGKNRAKPFIEGFEDVGFTNYLVVDTVDEGFNRFFALNETKKVLLIENDLPDIY